MVHMKSRVRDIFLLLLCLFSLIHIAGSNHEEWEETNLVMQEESNGINEESINIDPKETVIKTADMYMEEVQAYIEAENYLSAIEVLAEGTEKTGDAALAEKEKDLRDHIIIKKKKEYKAGKLENEYTYDKAGNMTEAIYYGDSGSVMGRREYEYDESGNETKYIIYNMDGSIDGWDESRYDENNNKIERICHSIALKREERFVYEYDEAGNKIKEIMYNENGSMDKCYETIYDETGQITQVINYDNDGVIFNNVYEYEQNETGSLCKLIGYYGDGRIQFSAEYVYDKAGNCTKYIEYYADGSIFEWQEYEYDEAGNRIKIVYSNSDGSICYWEEFEYDKEGNKVKEEEYSVLGELVSRWEYEYNEVGKLIKAEATAPGQADKVRAIEWSYDTFGNLVKIKRDGGVSERYEYVYTYVDNNAIEKYYGFYEITEFWPTLYYYRGSQADFLAEQEADMMLGHIVEIQENSLITCECFRWNVIHDGMRVVWSGNYQIEKVSIENPAYEWESRDPALTSLEEFAGRLRMSFPCAPEFENCRAKILGRITVTVEAPYVQEYYVMEDGIMMYSTMTGEYFYLKKLDKKPDKVTAVEALAEEEKEKIIQDVYGNYTITEFLPTKFYPALDVAGDVLLPQEEADMMIGRGITIDDQLFTTYDNGRLPNSEAANRSMEEYLLEKIEITTPDYQIEKKLRDDIFGLRDDMLPEKMQQEEYIEINVYPGYENEKMVFSDVLPQMYQLDDGRLLLYAMGEYFLLEKNIQSAAPFSAEEYKNIMQCLSEQVSEIDNEWADYVKDKS